MKTLQANETGVQIYDLFKQSNEIETKETYFISTVKILLPELKKFADFTKNNVLPVSENIKVEVKENLITITANDLSANIVSNLRTGTKGRCEFLVNYKQLADYLSRVKEGNLMFKIDVENLKLHIHRDSSVYTINIQIVDEFPIIEEINTKTTISLSAKLLKNIIDKTVNYCGVDDSRPVMTGINFEILDSEIKASATDAHKLIVFRQFQNANYNKFLEDNFSFILPSQSAKILSKLIKNCEGIVNIAIEANTIKFQFENCFIQSNLIAEKYPNVAGVIPQNSDKELRVNRLELISIINRVKVGANLTSLKL